MIPLAVLAACADPPDPCGLEAAVAGGGVEGSAVVTWSGADAVSVRVGVDGVFDRVVEGAGGQAEVWFLGAGEEWSFQVDAEVDGVSCSSEIVSLRLPPPPSGLPALIEEVEGEGDLTAPLVGTALIGSASSAVLLDRDGRYVWWALSPFDARFDRARFDADGVWVLQHPYDRDGEPTIYHIGWSGDVLEAIAAPQVHHDLVVLDSAETGGDRLAFLVWESRKLDGVTVMGDAIHILDDAGVEREIWNAFDAWPVVENIGWEQSTYADAVDWTHANSLRWLPEWDAFLVSFHHVGVVALIGRDGELRWTFGDGPGVTGDFSFADGAPGRMHSPGLTGAGLLLFENGEAEDRATTVTEFAVDWEARTASRRWMATLGPDSYAYLLGDALRLGDRTLSTWGSMGVLAEFDGDEATTWQLNLPLGHMAGFLDPVEPPWAALP